MMVYDGLWQVYGRFVIFFDGLWQVCDDL